MKKTPLQKAKRRFSAVNPADRYLLIIFLVLLVQSVYSLLFPTTGTEMEHIDVIIRTTSAGIFGYLLSANFDRREQIITDTGQSTSGQIGFAADDPSALKASAGTPNVTPLQSGKAEEQARIEDYRLQVIAAFTICLLCLGALIYLRDFNIFEENFPPSARATMAQLRDFVSGSVGFLIGTPMPKSKK